MQIVGLKCDACGLIFLGYRWIKLWLEASLSVAIFVFTILLISSIPESSASSLAMLSVLILMEIFVLVVLVASRRIRWFLQAQRPRAG